MTLSSPTRLRKGQGDGSGLFPENIYDIITSYLPIHDAIRSSLVSRTWRFRWRSIPYLVFKDDDFKEEDVKEDDLVKIGKKNASFISRILLLHKGRIKKFELASYLYDYDFMDVWIAALSVTGVEQFIFTSHNPEYLVHSDLFGFRALTVLKLSSCQFLVPPEFEGFPNLTDLVLEDITIKEPSNIRTLGPLIASCPMLKRLCLDEVSGQEGDICGFETSAPNLECLDLSLQVSVGPICIHAPKLPFAKISVVLEKEHYYSEDMPNTFNLVNVLSSINSLEKLVIESVGIFPIAANEQPNLPIELPYLKHLEMVVSFKCMDEHIAALCLVKSAPMLTCLHVKGGRNFEPFCFGNSFWGDRQEEGCRFNYLLDSSKLNCLQLFEFERMVGFCGEMSFIKYVLENAPCLSKLNISVESDDCCAEDLVEDLRIMKRETTRGTLRNKDTEIIF